MDVPLLFKNSGMIPYWNKRNDVTEFEIFLGTKKKSKIFSTIRRMKKLFESIDQRCISTYSTYIQYQCNVCIILMLEGANKEFMCFEASLFLENTYKLLT